jgi:hypothetical protein
MPELTFTSVAETFGFEGRVLTTVMSEASFDVNQYKGMESFNTEKYQKFIKDVPSAPSYSFDAENVMQAPEPLVNGGWLADEVRAGRAPAGEFITQTMLTVVGPEMLLGKAAAGIMGMWRVTRATEIGTQGYRSFRAFKRAMGPAGPGKAWHHIVEQTPSNLAKFGNETIHNTGNLIYHMAKDQFMQDCLGFTHRSNRL